MDIDWLIDLVTEYKLPAVSDTQQGKTISAVPSTRCCQVALDVR